LKIKNDNPKIYHFSINKLIKISILKIINPMLSYLTKFNNLPEDLRKKVSTPASMQAIGELEKKYDLSLATLVMKVMVKEISIVDLPKYFVFENNLAIQQAEELTDILKKNVFGAVADYLGIIIEDKTDGQSLNSWMEKKKEETAVRSSSFFFSPEDEEEVKNIAQKLVGVKDENTPDNSGEILKDIITKLRLIFSSEELNKRFEQILRTYVKGIRTKIDTRQALAKAIDSGGLELESKTIDDILNFVDAKISAAQPVITAKPPVKMSVPEDIMLPFKTPASGDAKTGSSGLPAGTPDKNISDMISGRSRDFDYDYAKLAALKKPDAEANQPPVASKIPVEPVKNDGAQIPAPAAGNSKADFLDFSKNNQAAAPMPDNKKVNYDDIIARAKRIAQDANVKINRAPAGKPNVAEKTIEDINIINLRRPNADNKVRMDDVKYVPKLMGPVDELREMDMVNFRRINKNPADAIKKIVEKINFLEDESYSQRLEGIKAWRQSPVNRLYLSIGQESIMQKKPINVIIDEWKSAKHECLTGEEFSAIMELNKEIRY
jgi:hypothetical protein